MVEIHGHPMWIRQLARNKQRFFPPNPVWFVGSPTHPEGAECDPSKAEIRKAKRWVLKVATLRRNLELGSQQKVLAICPDWSVELSKPQQKIKIFADKNSTSSVFVVNLRPSLHPPTRCPFSTIQSEGVLARYGMKKKEPLPRTLGFFTICAARKGHDSQAMKDLEKF